MGTNPKIPSGDFPPIPPRYLSKIPEDNIAATSYKSTSSAPTDYKIHLVDPYPTTTVKPNSGYTSNPIPNLKISNSNICQQIWIWILNGKKEPKDLKRYDANENNWRKAKENWTAAISAVQCDFILNYDYVPPYKSDIYACNTSDGYIFKILDLNLPTSDSHQCRNSFEWFCKRDPNGEGFITDEHGTWFSITALY